jgi:hypothetical protein
VVLFESTLCDLAISEALTEAVYTSHATRAQLLSFAIPIGEVKHSPGIFTSENRS